MGGMHSERIGQRVHCHGEAEKEGKGENPKGK